MQTMKIAYVIDQLGMGGAERVCLNLANLFHRNHFDVKLIVFNKEGELFGFLDDNLEVSILEQRKIGYKAYKKLVKELDGFDIVHVHMRQNYKFVRKALFLYSKNKKVILHDHYGKIVLNQKAPLFYKFFFKPKCYIGCSKLLVDWAKKKLRLKPDAIFLVNNFVMKYKTTYSYEKPKGLVVIGNLKEVKNQIFAVKIAKALNKDLTIYCTDLLGAYYNELSSFIDSIDYSNRIKFITGCSNVQLELKKYEFGLLTSTSEGDPLALIEYLAQGLPFLCSNVGESVKIIKDYFPHFVQHDFNIKKWVASYDKAVLASRKDIEALYYDYFSETQYLEKYKDIYSRLMAPWPTFLI